MDEKKYKSIVVIWGAILLILQALTLINVLGINPEAYNTLTKLFLALIATLMTALSIIFMVLSLRRKKSGTIIGIVVGIIYMFDAISFLGINLIGAVCNIIFAIAFVLYCISLLKSIKGVSANNEQQISEAR